MLSGTTTVTSGGTIEFIGTDASNNGLKLLSGATGELGSGAFLTDAKISKGITLVILSGGIASGGRILAGGLGILESGGQVTGRRQRQLAVHRQRRHLRVCQRDQRGVEHPAVVRRHA